jgi:hypothetical protein
VTPIELSPYIDNLREQLAVAAAAGTEETRELAERLTAPLAASTRLVLLDALSTAADEITRELAPGTVEIRLRGGNPTFVVTPSPTEDTFDDIAPATGSDGALVTAGDDDEGGMARLNLRLPHALKQRVEEASNAEGLSLNAWLIRAAAASLGGASQPRRRSPRGGDRYSGWVR